MRKRTGRDGVLQGFWSTSLASGVAALVLVALVYAAFGASARYGLTNWDDRVNYSQNVHLQRFGLAQLRWAWTQAHLGVYQPLAWMVLGTEWRLSHGRPEVLHVVSLLFHAVDVLVLWWFISALLARALPACDLRRRWWSAWFAAALFAVHPLRAEVVAWASGQPYLPSVLLFMLSVLAYLRAHPSDQSPAPRRTDMLLCFLFFVAALLCKAVAVSLPAFLIVLDVYPLRRLSGARGWWGPGARRVWIEKVPFVAVATVGMALAIWAKRDAKTLVPMADAGLVSRMAQSSYALWFYLVKTVVPTSLHNYYAVVGEVSLTSPRFLLAVIATVAAAVALIAFRRRVPWLVAVAAGYLVLLGANAGIVRIGAQIAADRYSYLATVPWWVCLAGLLCRVVTTARLLRLTQALGLAGLVSLTLLSRQQTEIWRDSVSLWSHALDRGGPGIWLVHLGLAQSLTSEDRRDESLRQAQAAYTLAPDDASSKATLGAALAQVGRMSEAAPLLSEATRLLPTDAKLFFNLGTALQGLQRIDEARAAFERAIALEPGDADALTNLATIELSDGHEAAGRALLARALTSEPRHAIAHFNLGALWLEKGEVDSAIQQFQIALRIRPNLAGAQARLDQALAAQAKRASGR